MKNSDDAAKLASELFPGRVYVQPKHIAEALDISHSSIRRYIKDGVLPSIRLCGSIRVKAIDVAAKLLSN